MSGVHPAIVGTPEPHGTAHWLWSDETATCAFAQALAQQTSLQNAYIELVGDLGAGKTTFVRHLLKALGVQGRIKSPTYAVVEPHEGRHPVSQQPLAIWHFDFYRFNDPQEFEEAGFRDLFASMGLKIAEWPNQAQGMLPAADLQLTLSVDDHEARHVQILASTSQGQKILQGLLGALPTATTDHAHSATRLA
ncbi:MAG: tRNA threonylcarbamoyladenosine biosynthesis protein TsaE [Pseudomonadota bacterium]|jgi:tRNA threonylcarbamoyladenosine biosynthesis protein TsaE